MDKVNLEQFGYSKELSEEFSSRTIGKVVLSTLFKQKKFYQPRIERMMLEVEEKIGLDWFDFAFMERQSNSIVLTFLKGQLHNQRQSRISFSDTCLAEGRFKDVITMIGKAKEIIGGN